MEGFLAGIGVTLAGVLAASIIQRHNENLRRKEQTRFEIYMHLLNIHGWYFWVKSAELKGKNVN